MSYQEPSHWVRTRAQCRTDFLFWELKQVVKRDVEEANRLPAQQRNNFTFRFKTIGSGIYPTFTVDRFTDGDEANWSANITFQASKYGIEVRDDIVTLFRVRPEWNAESGSCELHIVEGSGRATEKLHKVWEVSRKALTRLFFPEYQ